VPCRQRSAACIVVEGARWRCLRRGTTPAGQRFVGLIRIREVVGAWVEQCGSRSWRVRYRRQGLGVRSVPGFGSRRDAAAYAAGLEVDRRRRVWIDPADSAVTVADWVARWFRSLDLDPRTIESYRSRLRCHILPKFGALPLGAITALGVTEWARQLEQDGYAPSTVSSQLNLLSMLLTDAANERLIPFNPVRRRRRRGRRSRRAVPERIWATPECGPIVRLLIITAAWTGCRWDEPAGLHRDNVDLRRGVIVIDPLVGALHESGSMRWLGPPKTRASARTIALPPFLTALLREHLARHRYEFLRRVFRLAVDGSEASGTKAGCAAVRSGLTGSVTTSTIGSSRPTPMSPRRSSCTCSTISSAAGTPRDRHRQRRHRVWSTVGGWRRLSSSSPRWGSSRRPRPRPVRTPRRGHIEAGVVLQFCPTRSTRSRRKSITEIEPRMQKTPPTSAEG